MLCQKARATGIPLIRDIFTEALWLSYITFGFNVFYFILLQSILHGEPMLMLIKCAQII